MTAASSQGDPAPTADRRGEQPRVAAHSAGLRIVKHLHQPARWGRHHLARNPAEGSRRAADDPCEGREGCWETVDIRDGEPPVLSALSWAFTTIRYRLLASALPPRQRGTDRGRQTASQRITGGLVSYEQRKRSAGWLGRRPQEADAVHQVTCRLTNLLGQPAVLVGRQAFACPVEQRGSAEPAICERDLARRRDAFCMTDLAG
jgi:hypothetical protein